MKKFLLPLVAIAVLTACQESLEDRCAREAKEYTEKKCPAPIADNTTIDSLVFDKETHTMCYYYTLSGPADDEAVIAKANPRPVLLQEVRNATSTKACKDAGYSFKYVYMSKSQYGKVLFEAVFTEKDYKGSAE